MKFEIAKNLDRLRSTFEGFSRFKFGTATGGTGLSHNDEHSVEYQSEMQCALEELRNLVLETTSLETQPRTDLADDGEIEPFSLTSINFESRDTTADLLDPTVENHCPSDSVQANVASLGTRSLVLVQQA